jgi:sugar phosphate isomerase/epimerase
VHTRQFAISTHLYRQQRLQSHHLLEIAAHGFDAVEIVAERSHVDFENPAALGDLQQWLADAALVATSVFVAPGETAESAIALARRIPVDSFIVTATTPRDTAKLIEKLAPLTRALGVKLAIDSASMQPIGSAVHFVEDGVDANIGIALDFADAARGGDLVDAIEIAAEHIWAARIPADGAIEWASVLTTVQKVGYEGPMIFDLAPRGSTKERLQQAQKARERMERFLRSE